MEESDRPPALSGEEQSQLLALGRLALERYVRAGELLDDPPAGWEVTPRLLVAQGVFVSLHRGERLRGCVGFSEPIKPLAHAVMENVVSAAARDLRFPPVGRAELSEIVIEISVMSELLELSPLDVVPGVHGLLIERGEQHGLLLPQVAVEHGWDRESFLRQLCLKAGLPEDAWRGADTRILGFTAQVFSESRPPSSASDRRDFE